MNKSESLIKILKQCSCHFAQRKGEQYDRESLPQIKPLCKNRYDPQALGKRHRQTADEYACAKSEHPHAELRDRQMPDKQKRDIAEGAAEYNGDLIAIQMGCCPRPVSESRNDIQHRDKRKNPR